MTTLIRTGFRFTEELNTRLTRIAKHMGISKNALVLQILWDWLKANERPT